MPCVSRNDSVPLCASEHVFDVGGKRRIGVDIVPKLARGDAELDRESEDVDEFLTGMADEMRAEDAVACAFDGRTIDVVRRLSRGDQDLLGVQPRFGQAPPRSRASIIATESPARRTGPVTPMSALPPPRITTSNVSRVMGAVATCW
jgi:hypothetical protein